MPEAASPALGEGEGGTASAETGLREGNLPLLCGLGSSRDLALELEPSLAAFL